MIRSRSTRRAHPLAVIALCVAITLAACGGVKGRPTSSATTEAPGTPRPPSVARPSPHAELTQTATPAVDTLAFIRDGDIWLNNADGTDERRVTSLAGTDREVVAFQWLGDGKAIAYTVRSPTAATGVLADLDGTVLWEEPPVPSFTDVSWAPDGQRVALRDANAVRIEDRDGRSLWTWALQAKPVHDSYTGMTWSRDGKVLAFVDGEDIVAVSGDPPKARRLDIFSSGCVPGSACLNRAAYGGLALDPDGKSLVVAVSSGEPGQNTVFDVHRLGLGPIPTTQLLLPKPTEAGVVGSSLPDPIFAPDGRHVAFRTSTIASFCERYSRLVILEAGGGAVSEFVPREIGEARKTFKPAGAQPRDAGVFSIGFEPAPVSRTACFLAIMPQRRWLCTAARSRRG